MGVGKVGEVVVTPPAPSSPVEGASNSPPQPASPNSIEEKHKIDIKMIYLNQISYLKLIITNDVKFLSMTF